MMGRTPARPNKAAKPAKPRGRVQFNLRGRLLLVGGALGLC